MTVIAETTPERRLNWSSAGFFTADRIAKLRRARRWHVACQCQPDTRPRERCAPVPTAAPASLFLSGAYIPNGGPRLNPFSAGYRLGCHFGAGVGGRRRTPAHTRQRAEAVRHLPESAATGDGEAGIKAETTTRRGVSDGVVARGRRARRWVPRWSRALHACGIRQWLSSDRRELRRPAEPPHRRQEPHP